MAQKDERFNQRPFVAGTLVGVRTFKITPGNTLVGPMYGIPDFVPGENEARCLCERNIPYEKTATVYLPNEDQWAQLRKPDTASIDLLREVIETNLKIKIAKPGHFIISTSERMIEVTYYKQPEVESHRPASGVGNCGIYAWFDQKDNVYSADSGNKILGIIEGYGLVTVGTKGFRAEKAKIVALISEDTAQGSSAFLLAEKYQVPLYLTLEAATEEHPLTGLDATFLEEPTVS